MSAGTPFHDLADFVALPRVTALRLAPDGTMLAAAVQTLSACTAAASQVPSGASRSAVTRGSATKPARS